MKALVRALAEIKKLVLFVTLFTNFIDSVLVFLVFCLLFILFKIPGYYALIPFFVYFVVFGRRKIRSINYRYVEKRVPKLKERLRTVADNLGRDNELIRSLNDDVLRDVKYVNTGAFLGDKKLFTKIFFISIMSFLVILSSASNFAIIGWKEAVEGVSNLIGEEQRSIFGNITEIGFEEGDENIYGEESVAELGLEEIDLTLDTAASGININKVSDVENKEFNEQFPQDIYATTDSSYNERISKENQEIVKNYYESITGAN
ncbi:MAG: hypothetical protein Q8R00_03970 [Candidatus Nanoarchaeia archaeon]|nr:hypothetical protein [Candidatus Nanoarchaeia archaeon]